MFQINTRLRLMLFSEIRSPQYAQITHFFIKCYRHNDNANVEELHDLYFGFSFKEVYFRYVDPKDYKDYLKQSLFY